MLRNIFLAFFFITLALSNFVEAAEKPKVVVMDLGEHRGSFTRDVATDNVGTMVVDHIIEYLVDDGRFTVIDRELDLFEKQLKAKNLQLSGLISPKKAREIAKILNAEYLIYGNVNSVDSREGIFDVKLNGGKLHELKVSITVRMMDVETGEIIAVAKGEGVSKSSEIKGGTSKIFMKIGTAEIPQDTVHNAMKKAAYDVVSKLTAKFFES